MSDPLYLFYLQQLQEDEARTQELTQNVSSGK